MSAASSRLTEVAAAFLAMLGLALAALPAVAGTPVPWPAEWQALVALRRAHGNVTLATRWQPADGIRLRIQDAASPRCVDVALDAHCGAAHLVDETQRRTALASGAVMNWPENAVGEARDEVHVLLKFREHVWSIYLDDALQMSMAAPFEAAGAVLWPAAPTGALPPPAARFQPVEKLNFTSDFMVEPGAPNELYPWEVQAGDWRIHTVRDEALAQAGDNVQRVTTVPPVPERSANFYSLLGEGSDAVITTGYAFNDNYAYSVALQVNAGEAGLIFYHRDARNYYALTLEIHPERQQQGLVRLWRLRDGERTVLARVRTALHTQQWYAPEIRIENERLTCLLDGVELLAVAESLPAGGRIGLYVNAPQPVRFDDVRAQAIDALRLDAPRYVRFHTLAMEGDFFGGRSPQHAPTAAAWTAGLTPQRRRADQFLALGRAWDTNRVVRAGFAPAGERYDLGLVCGFTGPEQPHWRFAATRSAAGERFELRRVLAAERATETVQSWTLPPAGLAVPGATPAEVELMLDASAPGVMRFYRNGILVMVEHTGEPLVGAAGPLLGGGTTARITTMTSDTARRDVHREQPQTNEVFRSDNFMRHWASPEGQWVTGADGAMWHKGDFPAAFQITMPCYPDTELHAGIGEDGGTGAVVVQVTADGLWLRVRQPDGPESVAEHAQAVAAKPAEPAEKTGEAAVPAQYTVHVDGWWAWVTQGETVLLKQQLPAPLEGTRVKATGYVLADFAHSAVRRLNVISDFFTESPYRWILNGGHWEIVNRFQCQPSWSHMIGESEDGMAALWHKFVYGGNVTLEFYAGMRHGWYERAGDLNCTILAATTAPDSGYTATCTEWDYNHSQSWSNLYRRGTRVARSGDYLAPRSRHGNERRLMNPLISEGRPIHGAWYYIKIRRVGNRVSYYFDDELVHAFDDTTPLDEGLTGVWTFMNSMTLAQVQITFDRARPRPFAFEIMPASEATPPPVDHPAAADAVPLADHGMPLDTLSPSHWSVEDKVGHSRLEPFRLNASGIRVVNQLGSGSMLLQAALPPMPLEQVAGWRLTVRRTSRAPLNLYSSLGTIDAAGTFVPTRRLFHRISGTDFTGGDFTMTGETPVAPEPDMADAGGRWRVVTAWIPSHLRAGGSGVWVRLDGFGSMQPSPILCGIGGAFPGDAYAVRELVPITYGPPKIERTAAEPAEPLAFTLRRTRRGSPIGTVATSLDELDAALRQASVPGLNTVWFQIRDGSGVRFGRELAWITLPETVETTLDWHPERADAVVWRSVAGYPDPRFANATLALGERPLALEPGNDETRRARLPRTTEEGDPGGDDLVFQMDAGSGHTTVALARGQRAVASVPVLVALDGLTPYFDSFERFGDAGRLETPDPARIRVVPTETSGDYALEIRNRTYGQRLSAAFTTGLSAARFPLLRFRYRAGEMTRLTATFGNGNHVRLSDDRRPSTVVRLAHDLVEDDQWRTWLGFVSDAFTVTPYSPKRFEHGRLAFGSIGQPDQTGRHSAWCLDDVVLGPAVHSAEQLEVVPRYIDTDGVRTVFAAVIPGADAEAAPAGATGWQPHEPGASIRPSVDGLADGVHHLLLKAANAAGRESAATAIPFLLDTTPLVCTTAAVGASDNLHHNGVALTVAHAHHGAAPWDIEHARYTVDGKPMPLQNWASTFVHDDVHDTLTLNIAFVLRRHLDAAKDGQTLAFTVDGIVDGAGNGSPAVTVPITVNRTADTLGPTWYSLRFEAGVHWFWNWDGQQSATLAFTPAPRNETEVIHEAGQSPYLKSLSHGATGSLSRTVNWKPATHPWLSCRINLPQGDRGGRLALNIVLQDSEGKTHTLALGRTGRQDVVLNRNETITWQADTWRAFSYDVGALLRASGISQTDLDKLVIDTVTIQRQGATNNDPLLLDDFFLHAAAAPADGDKDALTWDAFDASGVATLEMTGVDEKGKTLWTASENKQRVDLGPLRKRAPGRNWVQARAKDHAGNLSAPTWFPLPQ